MRVPSQRTARLSCRHPTAAACCADATHSSAQISFFLRWAAADGAAPPGATTDKRQEGSDRQHSTTRARTGCAPLRPGHAASSAARRPGSRRLQRGPSQRHRTITNHQVYIDIQRQQLSAHQPSSHRRRHAAAFTHMPSPSISSASPPPRHPELALARAGRPAPPTHSATHPATFQLSAP